MKRTALLLTTILTGTLLGASPCWSMGNATSTDTGSRNASGMATAAGATGSSADSSTLNAQPSSAPAASPSSANAAPASAPPEASPASSASNGQGNPQQLEQTASQIIGDINIAGMALAQGMTQDAATHIAAARQAISALNGQMNSYDSGAPVMGGKMDYKTAKGEAAYWIPVENDHFVVRTVDGKHLRSKNPDLDVTDAQAVHFKMVLNTKDADAQLAKAQSDLSQRQYTDAMNDLQNATSSAVTETTVQELPLESARDNLILSRELLQDKDYRGASFALKHANNELKRVERNDTNSADAADLKKMQSQVHSLQLAIARQKPSVLKTAEMKIDGWIKDVKAKLHSA